jgi:hypothetical protein
MTAAPLTVTRNHRRSDTLVAEPPVKEERARQRHCKSARPSRVRKRDNSVNRATRPRETTGRTKPGHSLPSASPDVRLPFRPQPAAPTPLLSFSDEHLPPQANGPSSARNSSTWGPAVSRLLASDPVEAEVRGEPPALALRNGSDRLIS